ncbi:dTMP kinase [Dactylosporangium darangshiense]|uniref:Thymidylate kinase n=1 Tax=Dactylosporangium darangshiense TaxID=579108 RepID=A0ABP8DI24_9ACTN
MHAVGTAGDRPSWALGQRNGVLVTVEGVWGAGKTTVAHDLGQRLEAAGFAVAVLHNGPTHGAVGRLSQFLETAPLRSRTGVGGYDASHHATVDVLLRLCREAHHHRTCYRPALAERDVVIIDRGVYAKLAYALAVLAEADPDVNLDSTLQLLHTIVAPWFLHPDLAIHLDTPWPLARERAIARGHGGGNPAAVERLLFLPRYDAAYRHVLAAHPDRVRRIHVGLREPAAVADAAVAALADRLGVALPAASTSRHPDVPTGLGK